MAVMIQFKPDTPATGSITTVAVANLIDGETFTLDDGVNTATVFEFDLVPDGVVLGNVAVDVSAAVTADDVRDAIITAVNALGDSLGITASSGGAATVTLTNDYGGTVGNTVQAETVADAGFILTDMTGGANDGAFSGPLASVAAHKNKARWLMQRGVESSPFVLHKSWLRGGHRQPPNSTSILVAYGAPSWFESALEFNSLPYPEFRGAIASAVEDNILQVIDGNGAVATALAIRNGTVAG